jgi:hypothetical protein
MRPLGWVSKLGPPLLIIACIGAGSAVLPATLVADTGLAARACPLATAFSQAVASSARGPAIDAQVRLSSTLSAKGEVTGRVLTLNTAAGSRSKNLAAEAFASAAQSNVVVFGQADVSTGSTVSAIDLQSGCEYLLTSSSDVVRSAVIDPSLQALYVHSVSAADRSDLGVRRTDIASGSNTAALPALAAAAPFGITFTTSLSWSLDGDALGVQSCGLAACRTRLLQLADGAIDTFSDEAQGQIIGLTAGKLVTFDECPGLPCGLSAIDRSTKTKTDFDIDAYGATLDEDALGAVITVVTAAGTKEIRP